MVYSVELYGVSYNVMVHNGLLHFYYFTNNGIQGVRLTPDGHMKDDKGLGHMCNYLYNMLVETHRPIMLPIGHVPGANNDPA